MLSFFHLPYLAHKQLIDSMDLEDQFSLSKLSKRTRRVVKCVMRDRKYNVSLFSTDDDKLEVVLKRPNALSHRFNLPNDEVDTVKTTVSQLAIAYDIVDISIYFHYTHCHLIMCLIPFVKQLGVPLGTVASCFTPSRMTKWLSNCKDLAIFHPEFSCLAVNQLLKGWQKGSTTEHIILSCKGSQFNLKNALRDIPATPIRNVKVKHNFVLYSTRYDGFIIQRNDGSQAFVCISRGKYLCMSTQFEIEQEV